MPKEKFWEVAKRLGVKTPEAKRILADSGFTVRSNFTQMSGEMINTLMVALNGIAARAEAKNEPELKPVETAAAQPEGPPEPKEVIFFSPSRNHDIAYKKEVYFGSSAKVKEPARSIKFDDYEFRTSDPEEIEHVKSTRSFRVRSTSYPNGKIRIVNEAELARLKMSRQPKVTQIKSTGQDKLPDDGDDMNRLNPVSEVI